MRRFEDEADEEERKPLSPPKDKPRRPGFGRRAHIGDIEIEMLHPMDVQLRAPKAAEREKPREHRRPGGRIASKGTARMQLERARMLRDAEHLAKQAEIKRMSKPRTKEQKVQRAKEAKKEQRSLLNPVRCIIYFATNPVARFWLVCNIVFVAALTVISVIYLLFIFPMMRGLFNY